MHRICVFAGSNSGTRPEYQQAARTLGQELVARGLGLVYGGASVGLMGVIADTVVAAGGEAIGVIPKGLFRREVAHEHLTVLHEVSSMTSAASAESSAAGAAFAVPFMWRRQSIGHSKATRGHT